LLYYKTEFQWVVRRLRIQILELKILDTRRVYGADSKPNECARESACN